MKPTWDELQLEETLRKLFARRQPPEGFLERLLQRVAQEETARSEIAPSLKTAHSHLAWWWAAAAAVLLGSLLGTLGYRAYQENRARQAAQQAIVALHITYERLEEIQRAVLDTHAGQLLSALWATSNESSRPKKGGTT